MAERLARKAGKRVLVIDKRNHIGGNSYDYKDNHGVLLHRYGPHYFRTNSTKVRDYLSQFTQWHPVDYKVLSWTHQKYWSFPINLITFEQFLGRESSTEEMIQVLAEWKVPFANPANSEEAILSKMGRPFYDLFFKNYTRKQWQRDPKDLLPDVCGRIPIRTTRDDRYVSEKFQALPSEGYTVVFERMLDHPGIRVLTETSFSQIKNEVKYDHLIYSGSVDQFFDFRFGKLEYRSLRFENEHHDVDFFQPAMQVNFPNDFDYTRIVEIKHATGQKVRGTTIVKEFPQPFTDSNEPFYPVSASDTLMAFEKYTHLVAAEKNTTFLGRLANYKYYNMDQIIAKALELFESKFS